jgi:hypothetical protein
MFIFLLTKKYRQHILRRREYLIAHGQYLRRSEQTISLGAVGIKPDINPVGVRA